MKQEEKQLLLKDLCARLPFMPKIKITYQQQGIRGTDEGRVSCDFIEKIVNDLRNGVITDMQIYLRPMSSMTEDEKKEYKKVCDLDTEILSNHPMDGTTLFPILYHSQDYLSSIHVDYRGLIPMGLAIEVTEENNPYEK